MYLFSIGVAELAALGIIVIGPMYLANPRIATLCFGLLLPEIKTNVAW